MGSRSSDDPMDLGPFMQNYVLNNPFDLLKNPSVADVGGASGGGASGDGDGSNSSSRNSPVLGSSGDSPLPLILAAGQPRENSLVIKDMTGMVVDTPKGHLGSNLAFAQSLKNNLVSIGYVDVQDWLWNNYRHIPSHGAALSMASLLEHVQMFFPHITNVVLSRVMKFSFPDCNKFVNKQGAYYQSLVRRPDPDDYKDKSLQKAVEEVLEGHMTLGKAMATFAVEESAIVRMLVWEHNFMPNQTELSQSRARRGRPPGKGKDSGGESSSGVVDTSGVCSTPLGSVKILCKGERNLSDIDSSDLEEWVKDTKGNKRSRRKSNRKRKRPASLDEDFEYALDNIIRTDSESERLSEPDAPTTVSNKERTETQTKSVNSNSEEVTVKVEREDPEYGDISEHVTVSDETSQDSALSASGKRKQRLPTKLLRNKPTAKLESQNNSNKRSRKEANPVQSVQDRDQSPTSSGINGDLLPSASQNALLEEVEYMRDKLHEQETKNMQLLEELGCSRKEANALRTELCQRDFQFSVLAQEFFNLNSQFQKMSHKFKQYMTRTMDRNAELGISNNNVLSGNSR